MKSTLAALMLALLIPVPARAAAVFPYAVHEKTLDNGLRVVVIPFDSPGTVAFHTVVRTGSRDEVEPGHSGFAHFFEHMMFRGTKRFSQEAYNDVLKRMGADSNAYTTDDYTNYHIVGPAAKLETMMDVESDRFRNLDYEEEGFKTEALAVRGEYAKNASNPLRPMIEKLRDLAFDTHTYEHTTMGFLADIEAMPGYFDYSRSFFRRFYRPDNTVLLAVGDVEPDAVFALAEKLWGPWEKGYEAADVKTEPPQVEQRRAHVDWPSPTRPHLLEGYRSPAFTTTTAETAALGVIDQLLFARSAPLYQELVVDKQWVDSLFASAPDNRDPYLFTISARVRKDELLPKVEAVLAEHIERLAREPVDTARLERVKSHLRYALAGHLDSPSSVGMVVSDVIGRTGRVGSINELYDRYEALTPEDVQRVAKEVFAPRNLSVVTLSTKPAAAPEGER